jgi:hypothetical protein
MQIFVKTQEESRANLWFMIHMKCFLNTSWHYDTTITSSKVGAEALPWCRCQPQPRPYLPEEGGVEHLINQNHQVRTEEVLLYNQQSEFIHKTMTMYFCQPGTRISPHCLRESSSLVVAWTQQGPQGSQRRWAKQNEAHNRTLQKHEALRFSNPLSLQKPPTFSHLSWNWLKSY